MTLRLTLLALSCAASAASAASAAAQQPAGAPIAPMGRDEILAFARVQVAIVAARDSINARLAKSGNKTAKAQMQLQDTLLAQVEQILHHSGMSDAEYRRRTYVVSSDTATRRLFDSVVVAITNAPL